MKVYEAKLKKDTEVEAFSLVLGAAVETKLSKFAEEIETPSFFANEEKKIIYSVAMRPNKLIFRKDVNGEPANVFFSEETVEEIQKSYFKANNQGKVKMNLNHSDEKVEGVYPIESWIVNNPEIDKSKTLMMSDVQPKDFIIGYKIDNNDVWENFIKTGKVDGLSVEAFLDYEITKPKIEMNTEKTKENFFTHMMKFFASDEEVKDEVAESAEEESPEEVMADEPAENWEEKYKLLEAENSDLKEQIATMKAKEVEDGTKLETMKAEIAGVKTAFETFKAEAIAVKNVPPATVDFSKMTPLEKFRANK